jgi:CubicO group peptidase (beta-lactamase class C family)
MSDLEAAVDAALAATPTYRHLQSLLVARGGDLLLERYCRDRRATDLSNLHSVTKSVLATLTGIAIGDGALAPGTRLADILEPALLDGDPRKRSLTVEHLLTMTSGLDADSPHDIDEIADRGESWVGGVLAAPLRSDPGARFSYSNGAAHLLGAVVARAVGRPLARFADERLFGPLGIDERRWPADPEGNALGHGHLELRPRDLVKLGELYLRGGGELVPAWFVDAATSPQSGGGPPEGRPYGYLWWIAEPEGRRAYFAGGYGGQYLTVVPALELVVVTTGDVDVLAPTSRNLRELVDRVVLPSLA